MYADQTFQEELKKSFDMFGGAKMGYITKDGLRKIFNNIGVQFTPEEFLRIFKMMDLDNDGKIDYNEFQTIMKDWFMSAKDQQSISGKKRPRDYVNERVHIHKKILKFFLEFKKSNHFEKIRRNLGVLGTSSGERAKVQGYDTLSDEGDDDEAEKQKKEEDRARFLQWSEKVNLFNVRKGILSANDERSISPHLDVVIRALSALEFFHTPMLRLKIRDFLLNLFETIEACYPKFDQLVKMGNNLKPNLQFKICRIATLSVNGPCIAQTPVGHKYHVDKMMMKKMFQSFLPTFVDFLEKSPYNQIRIQCALFVGSFSTYDKSSRDYVLRTFGCVPSIVDLFSGVLHNHRKLSDEETGPGQSNALVDEEEEEGGGSIKGDDLVTKQTRTLRQLTWVLSILCGEGHSDVPSFEFVKPCLQLLSELFLYFGSHFHDLVILKHVLSALSHLLPGIKETRLHNQFLRLLSHPNPTVVLLVLTSLLKMFEADVFLCMNFMKQQAFFNALKTILNSPQLGQGIKLLIIDILNVFVKKGPNFMDVVLKNGFGQALTQMISSRNSGPFRHRSVIVFESMSRCNRLDLITNLVRQFKLVENISVSLEYMIDRNDMVIRQMYGQQPQQQPQYQFNNRMNMSRSPSTPRSPMSGTPSTPLGPPTQQQQQGGVILYDMTKSIFIVLHNILNFGDTARKNNPQNIRVNPFAEYFTPRVCQRIGTAIGVLRKHEIRQKEGRVSLEEHAKTILIRVNNEAQLARTRESHQLSQLLNTILKTFYGNAVTESELIEKLFVNYKKSLVENEVSMQENVLETIDDSESSYQELSQLTSQNINLLRRKESEIKRKLYMSLSTDKSNVLNQGQLDDLFKWWIGRCSDDGYISKKVFMEGMRVFAKIEDPLVMQSHWDVFDADGNGKIDFREFAIGLSMIFTSKREKQKSSQDNLLRLMFSLYDLNKDGGIDKDEVYSIFKSCREAEGKEINEMQLRQEVEKSFNDIDLDGNGIIDFEEFKIAVQQGKLKVGMNFSF